ncbi:MAG: NAD(P)-dependent oxidoreductase [Oscillospiraceae bacterium]|nr:NAD(P)-dependent oxidoreductase [Oscillospiraceae bacterium]
MIGMNHKLTQLEQSGTPIITSIVGAGQMGRGLAAQITAMQGMRPAVLVDAELTRARLAYTNAGLTEGQDFGYAETVAEGNRLLAEGKFVASTNTALATQCATVHCVVEATGIPDVGARVAMDAIDNKKHIVMLNVETDVCIGNLLYKKATEAGVVYTGSAGDEPGAVMELYDFACALGFEVRAMGKGKNNKIDYDCTPDTVAEEAAQRGLSARMLCSFKDGTKTMVEMTAMANATGFLPDVIGGHGPKCSVKDLPDVLSLKSEGRGGILNSYGVVEYVDGIAPGVFVIFHADQSDIVHELTYLNMGDGPNFCLYRPYHLCSLETPLSVARACIDGEPTIVPRAGIVAETGTVAKVDLKAGDALDGIGGYTIRGTFLSAVEAREKRVLPMGLVDRNTRVIRDVAKGALITYNDVALDESSLVLQLRREQDEMGGSL